MDSVNISYRISRAGKTDTFDFKLDPDNFQLIASEPAEAPEWAALEYKQCSHCPLNSEEHPHCPVALQLVDLVDRFQGSSSIDEVEMEVITEERRVIQKTVLQHAIASMLEVIFPACGCPRTEHMRPLARFHLPLASEEENIFRVTGMYLLGQYFRNTSVQGGRLDFRGLIDLYAELGILNKAIASRIRHATRSDSVKNAITLLDMYSTLVPLLLEDELVEMRDFFKAFLPEEGAEKAPAVTTHYLKSIKDASLELVPLEGEQEDEQDDEGDDEPDWLKEVRRQKLKEDAELQSDEKPEPEAASEEKSEDKTEERKESAVDAILKGSTLSLEPVADDDNDNKPESGGA